MEITPAPTAEATLWTDYGYITVQRTRKGMF